MEPTTSRTYRRHKRKLACRYCNARHIKCEVPEQSGEMTARNTARQCQACLDANEECDLDKATVVGPHQQPSSPSKRESKATKRQRVTEATLPQTLPRPGSRGQTMQLKAHMDDSQTLWLTNNPAPEGSEMLLVRLTDTDDTDVAQSTGRGENRVMYFGNDSIWSYSLQKARRTKAIHSVSPQSVGQSSIESTVHFSVPDVTLRQDEETDVEFNAKAETMASLRRQGAFSLPPIDVQKELLDAYFRWLYPLQPILDEQQFKRDFETGQVSMLLLQALLSVATTCCDDSLIRQHWSDRRTAQSMFHCRARGLYDADQEQDGITIVQSLFFMCFWWGSPTDVKDFSHWLSTSIHMAQKMGMHRSTKHSFLSSHERRLWRRIWWTLYIRDHFDAASVGRPMMINDADCDIEPLHEADFQVAESEECSTAGHCIEMAKLATFIGKIIRAEQHKHRDVVEDSFEAIHTDLRAWEEQLPDALRYRVDEQSSELKVFAAMLVLAFQFCKLTLFRKQYSESTSMNTLSTTSLSSANATTRIVEELLTEGLLPHVHVHLIAVVFASLATYVVCLEQSEGSRKAVLQHKAQLSLLGLAEFRSHWGFVDWMYRMFSNVLERIKVNDGTLTAAGEYNTVKNRQGPLYVGHSATRSGVSYEQQANTSTNTIPLSDQSTDIPLSGNWLDPFLPLDNFEWYEQNSAWLGYLDPQIATWPNMT